MSRQKEAGLDFLIDKLPINELFTDNNKYYFDCEKDNQLNLFNL